MSFILYSLKIGYIFAILYNPVVSGYKWHIIGFQLNIFYDRITLWTADNSASEFYRQFLNVT